ncbi:CopG family transcriptional regulator [Halosegnis sp.]|uniref:CopG family transcriptional regulator n=1 Tax=Halosegnis sp. TaxID=2864959 RepID=UPI0035D45CA1
MRRFEFVASESTASAVERLAREYGLTEQEVVEQFVELGLAELDSERTDARDGEPRP